MIKNSLMKKIAIFVCIVSMFTNVALAETGFSAVEEVNSSIISLPGNSVKGQVNVGTVKGNTATNLWINKYNVEGIYSKLTATGNYIGGTLSLNEVPLKPSTEYTIIFEVVENTLDGDFDAINPHAESAFGDNKLKISAGETGRFEVKFTTVSDFTGVTHAIRTYVMINSTTGYVKYRGIVIEGDYLDTDISITTGTKSTLSARLKSVGKNLFNIDNYLLRESTHYSRSAGGHLQVESLDTRTGTSGTWNCEFNLKPNTQYTLSTGVATGLRAYELGNNDPLAYALSTQLTFTTGTDGITYIKFVESSGFPVEIPSIQLEEGSSATTYEPYQESIQYITLPEVEELRSLKLASREAWGAVVLRT